MQPDFTPVENTPSVAPQEPLHPMPPAEPVTPQALPPVHPVRWNRQSSFFAIMLVILVGSVLAIMANPVAMANIRDVAYLLPGMLNPSEKTMLVRSGAVQTPPPVAVPVPSPKPDPYVNPVGRFTYVPQVGWEVLDESISPDGKTMAVVLTSVFPHATGGNTITQNSVSRLLLSDMSSKKEEILLERPVLTRTDILDGPRQVFSIGGVTWAPTRNSLIITGHDTLEELSLADKSLKTHFTYPRNAEAQGSWDNFSGMFLPEYWPQINAVVFSQTAWEGTQTWIAPLDQGPNAVGNVVAAPGYEGPRLETIWGDKLVISDYCKTNADATDPKDFCRELLIKSFPSLEQASTLKFMNTTNVGFTRAGSYLLAAYSALDSDAGWRTGKNLQGEEVMMWTLDPQEGRSRSQGVKGENLFYLQSVGQDLQVHDILKHRITSANEGLYWEFMDSGAVVVTFVELDGSDDFKAVRKTGEKSFMVGAE